MALAERAIYQSAFPEQDCILQSFWDEEHRLTWHRRFSSHVNPAAPSTHLSPNQKILEALKNKGHPRWMRFSGHVCGRLNRQYGLRRSEWHQIAAITGHATLAEVQRYTKAADRKRLAQEAMKKLIEGKP
jgi:integrase